MLEFFKKLLPYLKPYKGQAIMGLLMSLPYSAIKGYQAYLVKDIIDNGMSVTANQGGALTYALILIGLGVLNYPVRFFALLFN
jgi:ABC-type multidrug transport system fused ATPase/permease subunit